MSVDLPQRRARDNIFRKLRSATAGATIAAPDVAAWYRQHSPVASATDDLAGRFMNKARGWQAQVIETTETGWPQALAAIVADKGLRRVLAGRDTPIAAALSAALPVESLVWYDDDLPRFKSRLFAEIDAGITTTCGGIAETGTLILWPDIAEPRTLSLVPPVHIALVRASQLCERWVDALAAEDWAGRMPTNALLVTGPSKTADIQRMLVYGAHGPRELVILLLRDEVAR